MAWAVAVPQFENWYVELSEAEQESAEFKR
jgi:hypothetical protein